MILKKTKVNALTIVSCQFNYDLKKPWNDPKAFGQRVASSLPLKVALYSMILIEKMKSIYWEDYLCRDELVSASLEKIHEIEKEIGYQLPRLLAEMIMNHGGQCPENLVLNYPNGKPMTIECIYHAFQEDDEDSVYTIQSSSKALRDEGYFYLVPFTHRGNVFIALDYSESKEPSVVFVFRDTAPDNPEHKHKIADNFDKFIMQNTR